MRNQFQVCRLIPLTFLEIKPKYLVLRLWQLDSTPKFARLNLSFFIQLGEILELKNVGQSLVVNILGSCPPVILVTCLFDARQHVLEPCSKPMTNGQVKTTTLQKMPPEVRYL